MFFTANFTSVSEREKIDNNLDRANDEPSESEPLFTDVDFIPKKKNLSEDDVDDDANCSAEYNPEEQYAQRWSSPDDTDCESNKSITKKRFVDVAVMTERESEIRSVQDLNENIRISNLMFCKFISHELEQHTGKKRYNIMQKIIEALKDND